jgi:protocatechuate 3,4-dioxygenase beta subunit
VTSLAEPTRRRGRKGLRIALAAIVAATLASACVTHAARQREPVVGLPCEGCEAVFDGLPLYPVWSSRIAPANEPGEPMRIDGIARWPDGRAAPGVIVYAYHTNAKGLYPRDTRWRGMAARHGRLRGWAKTDEQGRYRFRTIRPAGYPDTDIPQHVHMHVIEPGRCTYYIDDLLFDDDPRLTPGQRAAHDQGRGGSGIATPVRDTSGTWFVTRDIRLGEKIDGYPRR